MLSMGKNAIFVESSRDNRNNLCPPPAIPYQRMGPKIAELFERVFIDGLHNPNSRPSASEWERALCRTLDLLLPSSDKKDQWFVLGAGMPVVCPFTYQKPKTPVPIIDFFREDGEEFKHEQIQLVIWKDLQIFDWHRFSGVNASDSSVDKSPRGVFSYSDGKWWLQNQSGECMLEVDTNGGQHIEHQSGGKPFQIYDQMLLVLSRKEKGRLGLIRFYHGNPQSR